MSDDAYGAPIAKLRLARRLTELRVEAGYTANHVCDMLSWGRGKVGRFEANQWKRPEMSDIRDLLRFYEADDHATREIETLALRATVRPWWRDFHDIFDNEFPGFQADASRIRVFFPLVVPGLLQTADYVDALMRSAGKPPAWRRRATEARLRRQQILERENGTTPQLQAVITEASLLYRWGSRADRRTPLLPPGRRAAPPGRRTQLQPLPARRPPRAVSAPKLLHSARPRPHAVFPAP